MLRIRNWETYQHYKGREKPPWIKLYRSLLDDKEWFDLDGDASKMLANCLLLASERRGELPSIAQIAWRLRISEKEASEKISRLSHWIIFDDSDVLASCKQDACADKSKKEDKNKKENVRSRDRTSFLDFYSAYPRKQSKQDAFKAYGQAMKAGATHDEIMAGLARSKVHDRRFHEKQFTPLPASWLRAQGYADVFGDVVDPRQSAENEKLAVAKGYEWDGEKWKKCEAVQ